MVDVLETDASPQDDETNIKNNLHPRVSAVASAKAKNNIFLRYMLIYPFRRPANTASPSGKPNLEHLPYFALCVFGQFHKHMGTADVYT